MSIELPNLDDQVFDDIVETARRKAMQYFPQWTNFNPSDPGVTILELFAWLKEMQQYHLNRITRGGILACLQLLGISPQKAAPAVMTAVFDKSSLPEKLPFTLPGGFPFTADGGLVFETLTATTIGETAIDEVWVDMGEGPVPWSGGSGGADGIAIEPFGAGEIAGACLYIGFDKPAAEELCLFFDIYDDYPVARVPYGDDYLPSRRIQWEYGPDFTAATPVVDMTYGFSVSGDVLLGIHKPWEKSKPAPDMPECYWLRARLTEKGAEETPRIKKIVKDFAILAQVDTLSAYMEMMPKKGVLPLRSYTGIYGEHIVFTHAADGWKRMPAPKLKRFEDRVEIKAGAGSGTYRVVCVKKGFNALLSTSTNLPSIRLDVPAAGFMEQLGIMIEDDGIWQDWKFTGALHTAGPYDKVFTVDDSNGNMSIIFGDNVHGACPPAGKDNVLISSCRATRGGQGNIQPYSLTGVPPGTFPAVPENVTPAVGGRNPESIPDALKRAGDILSEADRCVTTEDYEHLAITTPGTRILKVRACDGFDPKTGGKNIPALVTVVVQPYSSSKLPLPDATMIDRIKRRLDKGRLLSTRIEVAAPEYVPVSVRVDIVATDGEVASKSIRECLTEFFSPKGNRLGIGRPIQATEVAAAVHKCRGVQSVSDITLTAPERVASTDRSGNLEIQPHAIAYPGQIDIHITG